MAEKVNGKKPGHMAEKLEKRAGSLKGKRAGRKRRGKKKAEGKKLLWILLSLSLAAALLFWPVLSRRKEGSVGPKVPPGNWSYGIDLSHNNEGDVEWDSLAVMIDGRGRLVDNFNAAKEIHPVDYVFIKATEGISMKDRKFKVYWKESSDHSFARGAYHFFRSSKDPKLQAENFCKTVGRLSSEDLPPVLDVETMHRGCTKKLLNERVLVWLKSVEAYYGVRPIVYTSESFALDVLSAEISGNYPLWIAHYKTDRLSVEKWLYWQFTDKALVRGVQRPVDLSVKKF